MAMAIHSPKEIGKMPSSCVLITDYLLQFCIIGSTVVVNTNMKIAGWTCLILNHGVPSYPAR